jgi:hypothetical protein
MTERNSIHNASQDIPIDSHFIIALSYLTLLVCGQYISKFFHLKKTISHGMFIKLIKFFNSI